MSADAQRSISTHRYRPTADIDSGHQSPQSNERPKPVVADFIGYASTYVGAGLISGATVHYPLDPPRFVFIGVAGGVLFLLATMFSEFFVSRQQFTFARFAAMVPASLALSFGIGSLSGGIQHFVDVPARAAVLIPVGIVLAFIAYVLRYHASRWRSMVRPAGIALVAAAALTFVALQQVASTMPSGSHDHGSSHGEEATRHPEPTAPPSAGTPSQGPAPTPQPTEHSHSTPGTGHGH